MCIWWRLCVCSVGQGGMLSTCINVCAHVCSLCAQVVWFVYI